MVNITFEPEFSESTYTFNTEFNDYIALYCGIERVWISNDGILFAEMRDGVVQQVGPVTSYYYAVEHGFEGTFEQWVEFIENAADNATLAHESAEQAEASADSASLYATNAATSESNAKASEINAAASASTASQKAEAVKSPVVTITYQSSESGIVIPSGEWSPTPVPTKGEYLWKKTVLLWGDNTTTTTYDISYNGMDGEGVVTRVNGRDGVVVLTALDINTDLTETETVATALQRIGVSITDAQIDTLF